MVEPSKKRLPDLISGDAIDAELPDMSWTVDGWILEGGMNLIYAEKGTGKSYLSLNWSVLLAAGHSQWEGISLKGLPIVWVAGDGYTNLKERKVAIQQAYGIRTLPNFHLLPSAVNLMEERDVAELLEKAQALTQAPALCVFDNLPTCMVGGDENQTKDMQQALHNARLLIKSGWTILLLHYPNSAGQPRGSTALHADCDTILYLKGEGESKQLTYKKERIVRSGSKELNLYLPKRDGEEPVFHLRGVQQSRRGQKATNLSPDQEAVLNLLRDYPDGLAPNAIGERLSIQNVGRLLTSLGSHVEKHGKPHSKFVLYRLAADGCSLRSSDAA